MQLAVDTASRAIVGVDVTNAGSDAGLAEPMRERVEEHTGGVVTEQLVDGGYVKLDDLDRAAAAEPAVTLYMPVPKPRKPGADPHQAKKTDSDAVAEWRQRMGTPQAKEVYKERAATIETINGELKTAPPRPDAVSGPWAAQGSLRGGNDCAWLTTSCISGGRCSLWGRKRGAGGDLGALGPKLGAPRGRPGKCDLTRPETKGVEAWAKTDSAWP